MTVSQADTDHSPRLQGLYDPSLEHDACGVGMIANIKGRKSQSIVKKGLDIIVNLAHRGACGCDERTGDGAGIMIQKPHKFLKSTCIGTKIQLPDEHDYGVGLVFLPQDIQQRRRCMRIVESAVGRMKQRFLGWRKVPVMLSVLGSLAREQAPVIHMAFIGRRGGSRDSFERKLYLIRKIAEKQVRQSALNQKHFFHIPSLSSFTLIYKGMMLGDQLQPFFPDLSDPDVQSAFAIVHQRYSTNTFPSWHLAQPFRFLCHNGEINTLKGNVNALNARQALFASDRFGEDMEQLLPVVTPGASDSAILDNALEILYHTGRSLPHAMMMLIPEAWQHHQHMSSEKKAFYQYHACLMEPWDGPACIAFSDGNLVGAVLDRNGLRPCRYTLTQDDVVVLASETGVINLAPELVKYKGRLEPGRMFIVDLNQGRIVSDDDIKNEVAQKNNYGEWLTNRMVTLDQVSRIEALPQIDRETLLTRQICFGYTREDLSQLLEPMALKGAEPIGSMGDDIPPAILSKRPRLLYDYFKQLFAQVTNPPLDAIREKLVTSLFVNLGAERNLFAETPAHCAVLALDDPILSCEAGAAVKALNRDNLKARTFHMLYPIKEGKNGLRSAMTQLFSTVALAVQEGINIIILSDVAANADMAPIPALLATSGLHHHLTRAGLRAQCSIVVETAEAREVHHFCCLIGYGASAIIPVLAYETLMDMVECGRLRDITTDQALLNYRQASAKGILKVMSKMGISTLQSYRGAQVFEAIGLNQGLVEQYFAETAVRIMGAGLGEIAQEVALRHEQAYPSGQQQRHHGLDQGGKYKWRRDGEKHQYSPLAIAKLQQAVRKEDRGAWEAFCSLINTQNKSEGLIRGLLGFKPSQTRVPLAEVEPWTEIVKRFKTGAMSYGSISKEAHETQAIAMNRLGAKSNSGEGGEDADRYPSDPNGDWRNSAIKQVASGRFGVTIHYLASAAEIQIKMAQGAKPGEGGQLPASKVYPWIAKTRHSTPYVGLISPPPHHDIYSIEDLAQLIFDLRNANPKARISVKLVSEVGVGTVAAGVAKAGADVILISGDTGGTGAAALTAIRHGGLPWELGLAETQQTLSLNGLRGRVALECDGQLKTARDVAVACLLGAQEFGFGTVSLVALGCVMMRVCHLNTCPVGIATQDPDLRRKFTGKPEAIVNFMRFVAEDLRKIMADLGLRSIDEMVGRVDLLEFDWALEHWKAGGLDLSPILAVPKPPPAIGRFCVVKSAPGLSDALDRKLIKEAEAALTAGIPVTLHQKINNTQRTLGTLLSHEITQRYGVEGLKPDTITLIAQGSAGQSLAAFGAPGLTIHLQGEANDYLGKGLSGANLSIRPPERSTFQAEENIIVGNVALYGATSGEVYIRGRAGERFAVRNSGAKAVVEGVGDHGCEYMTGGRVVILGAIGRNFAAGMSGGIAYIWDVGQYLGQGYGNLEMVVLERVTQESDHAQIQDLLRKHWQYTQSPLAQKVLQNYSAEIARFIKVIPIEYKRALEKKAE